MLPRDALEMCCLEGPFREQGRRPVWATISQPAASRRRQTQQAGLPLHKQASFHSDALKGLIASPS